MVGEGRPSTSLPATNGVFDQALSTFRRAEPAQDVHARDKPEHDDRENGATVLSRRARPGRYESLVPMAVNAPIRDQRRQELIQATIAVIARHGYSGTTVARVAERA